MIRSASVSPAVAALRLGAVEQALLALRRLRVEVEQVRPGLVLDRIDGWHADAADLYAERARELRFALAGAEQALLDAEARLEVEHERARAAHAAALAVATPDRPVTGSGGRW
ncbi:hypothetical protein GCM10017608_04110 [Agromyces luteolus]|uniref:Uncharacterized protein n=1 Tax=Agromyces luteolus TaxID=88373 RepID=A0A7C9HG37_9MICO|nr:hypothetical protein [Agromyces luteolus]MUN05926.1 hypothetical protein [Agromyces luteolus]GLK26479.1 hypothetical protein GCM10017608_04110 [Agromyces luteolus]